MKESTKDEGIRKCKKIIPLFESWANKDLTPIQQDLFWEIESTTSGGKPTSDRQIYKNSENIHETQFNIITLVNKEYISCSNEWIEFEKHHEGGYEQMALDIDPSYRKRVFSFIEKTETQFPLNPYEKRIWALINGFKWGCFLSNYETIKEYTELTKPQITSAINGLKNKKYAIETTYEEWKAKPKALVVSEWYKEKFTDLINNF